MKKLVFLIILILFVSVPVFSYSQSPASDSPAVIIDDNYGTSFFSKIITFFKNLFNQNLVTQEETAEIINDDIKVIYPNGGESIPYSDIFMAGDLIFRWTVSGDDYKPTENRQAFILNEKNEIIRQLPSDASSFFLFNGNNESQIFSSSFIGEKNINVNGNYKIKVCDYVNDKHVCDISDDYFAVTSVNNNLEEEWKKFKNEEYDFSFDYPSNYEIIKTNNNSWEFKAENVRNNMSAEDVPSTFKVSVINPNDIDFRNPFPGDDRGLKYDPNTNTCYDHRFNFQTEKTIKEYQTETINNFNVCRFELGDGLRSNSRLVLIDKNKRLTLEFYSDKNLSIENYKAVAPIEEIVETLEIVN